MNVTMVLCDFVQVAEGKLYIAGGGWNVTSARTGPMGLAVLIQVPWTDTNRQISAVLTLVDADGRPVLQPGPDGGELPVRVEGQLEVGRPPGAKPGIPFAVPLAMDFPPLSLKPGARYTWSLSIDGAPSSDEVTFSTREDQSSSG